jgi:flagellar biosynthesis/type III secretory pathway chaperone
MKIESIEEIIETEVELTAALLELLKQQQQALIHLRHPALVELVNRQNALIHPLEALEKERVKLMGNEKEPQSEAIAESKQRLKQLTLQILKINAQNKALIQSAMRFFKKIISAITDDYTKKIVDAKI